MSFQGDSNRVSPSSSPSRSLQETLRSINKFNELLTTSPEFIFKVNNDGVYLDFEVEDTNALFYSPEEFLGKKMIDLFDDVTGRKAMECLSITSLTGEVTSLQYNLNIKGSIRTYYATFSQVSATEILILAKEVNKQFSRKRVGEDPVYTIGPYINHVDKKIKEDNTKGGEVSFTLDLHKNRANCRALLIASQPLLDPESTEPVASLDIENERFQIAEGLKKSNMNISLHHLCEATFSNLIDALKSNWDIIHVSAHGSDDAILLENGLGSAYHLSLKEFSKCFSSNKKTRLVVLSACSSSDIGQEIYEALSQNGSRAAAVVAIQGDMDEVASCLFAQQFYGSLGTYDVEEAFFSARKAVASSPLVGDIAFDDDQFHGSTDTATPWSKRFMLFSGSKVAFTDCTDSSPLFEELYIPRLPPNTFTFKNSPHFVGRAEDIVKVVKLFEKEKAPRVCIYGPGGIGKTELAKGIANWLRQRGHFQHVLWTTADATEESNRIRDVFGLIGTICSTFNLVVSDSNLEKYKAVIYQYCRTHSTLFVIDSWENIAPKDRWGIWTFLNSLPQTSRVLITSRDILPAIEAVNFELDRLDKERSRILFWKILSNSGYFKDSTSLNFEEISLLSDVVDTLEGYPLAIIVTAAQSRSKALKQIQHEFGKIPKMVLEGVNEITSEPQGIWTSLDYSYDTLSESEKLVFRQMSIFLEPVPEPVISAVTKIESMELSTILDVLVRRSLVRRSKNLFSLHKIVREYGKSKLVEDPIILHQRAVVYYEDKFFKEEEIDGLINAHYHLFALFDKYGNKEAGNTMIDRFQVLTTQLTFGGLWNAAKRVCEEVLQVAEKLNDKKSLLATKRTMGVISLHTMKFDLATKYLAASIQLAIEINDKQELIKSLNTQGYVVYYLRDYFAARQILVESLAISKALKEAIEEDVAETMFVLGAVYTEDENYKDAQFLFDQSIELLHHVISVLEKSPTTTNVYRLKVAKWKLSLALNWAGKLYLKIRDLDTSKRLHLEALQISKEMENPGFIHHTLRLLAFVHEEGNDIEEAKKLYLMALQVARGISAHDHVAQILQRLALISSNQDDEEETRSYLSECLRHCKANYDLKMIIKIKIFWAKFEYEHQNFEKSKELLHRALLQSRNLKDSALTSSIELQIKLVEEKEAHGTLLDWSLPIPNSDE